jgi:two-component system chemotaxis response regulator CheY
MGTNRVEARMSARRVLSLGQCGFDQGALARTFRQHFAAEVVPADSPDEALDALRRREFALVLVNRILDADGSSGVAFVRLLKADEQLRGLPVMLVSNYDHAQEEAVQAGAVPGFGKGTLGHPQMLARVRALLEES